jgi:D-alanyl-D-alanine carboxypeptidase
VVKLPKAALCIVLLGFTLLLASCSRGEPPTAPPSTQMPPTSDQSDEAPISDAPAAQALADFVDAFNAGDEDQIADFATQRFSSALISQKGGLEQIRLVLGRIYAEQGRLALREVVQESENSITAWVQSEATGFWFLTTLTLEGEAGQSQIVQLNMVPDEGPANAQGPASPLTAEEFAALVDAHLDGLEEQGLFSGVVLIAHEGEILLLRAMGPMNEDGDPNTTDTRFALASTSKTFTAAAVVQLADRGLLNLDDPVSTYLPDYPEAMIQGVTIRHLLTHTSGLGSFNYEDIRPLTTIDEMLLKPIEPPAFSPGTDFRYSNGGFVLLGAVIEQVSGQTFWEYLDEHIFRPAGMASTGAFAPDSLPDNTAYGLAYQRLGVRASNASILPARPGPAGDFYTTAEDMLRFATALQGNTLIGPELTEEMFTPAVSVGTAPSGATAEYGLGFVITTSGDVVRIGHTGGFPGISSWFAMYPDLGYTVVILSNYDSVGVVLGDWTDSQVQSTQAAADAMLHPTFTPMATAEPTREYWGWTRSIAISNDGNSIAVGTDKGVVVFDTESWNVLCSISTEHPVTALAFSPDDRQLAFGLDQGQLMIIDAMSGVPLAELTGHSGRIETIEWSPDGERMASGAIDYSAIIWDAEENTQEFQLSTFSSGIYGDIVSVAWSPDGTTLATGDGVGNAILWNAATGEIELNIPAYVYETAGADHGIRGVAWSPDGLHLLVIGNSWQVSIWDIHTGEQVQVSDSRFRFPHAAWMPDGTPIGIEDTGYGLVAHNLITGEELWSVPDNITANLRIVALNLAEGLLVIGGTGTDVKVWNVETGEQLRILEGFAG